MALLAMDGLRMIKAGKTTPEEVLSVAYIEETEEEDTFATQEEEAEEKETKE